MNSNDGHFHDDAAPEIRLDEAPQVSPGLVSVMKWTIMLFALATIVGLVIAYTANAAHLIK